MTRELFTEIISRQLWLPLLCIILAYLISWFLGLRLGLLVMGVRTDLRKLSLICIFGSLYSFWAKQLLPMPLVGLGLPVYTAMLLWLNARGLHPLKYGWGSLTILLTSLISNTIFQAPFCAADARIAHFLLQTPWGYVVGTGLESIGSVLALFLLPQLMPKLKAPLVPLIGQKTNPLDFSALLVCLGLSFMVYLAAIVLYMGLVGGSQLVLLFFLFQLGSMVFMIVGHFQTLKSIQKRFEMEKYDLVAEKEKLATEKDLLEAEKTKLAADKVALEARVNQLEEKTLELAALNEQLMAKTRDPREAATEIAGIAKQVLDYANVILEQQRTFLIPKDSGSPAEVHLTPREREVLALVGQAKNNQQISEALNLEETYIRNIIYNLNTKLGTKDRAELVLFAIKNKIVEIK
jgi:DNA-binding NarL/FixJ family response regulator